MFGEARLNRVRNGVGWTMIAVSTLMSVQGLAGIAATTHLSPVGAVIGVIVGLLSVIAPMVAMWRPRVAARMYLWMAPAAIILIPVFHVPFGYGILGRNIGEWRGETSIAVATIVFMGSLVVPCFFWRWAVRRDWPGLLANSRISHRPGLAGTLGFVMFIGLSVIALLLALNLPWREFGDCGGGPLISDGVPFGLDFTASILFVGPRSYRDQSFWSVARVDRTFSREAKAMPSVLILRGGFKSEDGSRRYFVEGRRSHALLGRLLPIIEPLDCGHTKHLEDAVVEVRVLRDGPPKSGVRLIGQVYKGDVLANVARTPIPGIAVSIEGPAGKIESLTDPSGVYDVLVPASGSYTIRSATAHETIAIESRAGDVHIINLYLP